MAVPHLEDAPRRASSDSLTGAGQIDVTDLSLVAQPVFFILCECSAFFGGYSVHVGLGLLDIDVTPMWALVQLTKARCLHSF